MLRRSLTVVVTTAALLTAGFAIPPAGAAVEVPETVSRRLPGLPPAPQTHRSASSRTAKLSRPVATPMPFSMVGFELPADTVVEFRTSRDGRKWTPWTRAEINDSRPDPDSAEGRAARHNASEPVWVGQGAHLQTRVSGAGAAARPERVPVHLIDSAGLGRSLSRRLADRFRAAWNGAPTAARAETDRPPIVTRRQWGADERMRRGRISYASGVRMGIVHHTAGANAYSRAQAPAVVRGVYRYHTRSNGWNDIGYNFLIDRYGTIYEGRAGGVDKAVIGAHSGGFNTGTFGVALVGNHVSSRPTAAAQAALTRLLAWKYEISYVDVTRTSRMTSAGSTRWAKGKVVRLRNLSGHRDVSSTTCPGARAYPLLPSLQDRVVALQGPVLVDPTVSPRSVEVVNGSSLDGPISFSARLRPAGAWTMSVTAPDGTIAHSAAGSGTRAATRWDPRAAARGDYTYTLASPGRRSVTGTITLAAPTITGTAAPRTVARSVTGALSRAVRFRGAMYEGATWRLTLTSPNGLPAASFRGTGKTLSQRWTGPALETGVYTWKLRADDVPEVSGRIRVVGDRFERTGEPDEPVAAAAAVSASTFGPGEAVRAVVTPLRQPELGLAAAPLAGADGAVLATDGAQLPAETLDELHRVLPTGETVYVLGGERLVPAAVTTVLAEHWTVVRVPGTAPVRVAARVADLVVARTGQRSAVLVDGNGAGAWRQGVSGVGPATASGLPVLLTASHALSPATASALRRNAITSTVVVSDPLGVSDRAMAKLPDARRVTRSGSAGKAVASARRLWLRRTATDGDAWTVVNLDGDDGWLRAVAAAPLMARRRAPLLAVSSRSVPSATRSYLGGLGYGPGTLGSGLIVGSAVSVGVAVEDQLSGLVQ